MSRSPNVRELALRYPLALIGGGVVMYAIGPNLIAASSLDGPGFLMLRLAIGTPFLLLIVGASSLRRRLRPSPRPRIPFQVAWLWSVLAGFSFAAHQLSFMTAVKRTSVADTALLDTLSPVVVMLLAIPMFGERPGPRFVAWSGVAMGGAAIIAVAGASGPRGDPIGIALAGVSVIFFALFFLLSKAARPSSDVWPFLLIVSVIATATAAAYMLAVQHPVPEPTRQDVLLATALATGPGALGHFLMTWPLAALPANLPPVVRLLTPFLASAIAWVVLFQPMEPYHLMGGMVTAGGVLGALMVSDHRVAPRTPAFLQ